MKKTLLTLLFLITTLSISANFFYDTWEEKSFNIPQNTIFKELPTIAPQVIITTTERVKERKILDIHFGVNTNFGAGPTQLERLDLYKDKLGSFRYPAGSGSNIHFFDGNIPEDVSTCVDKNGKPIHVSFRDGTHPGYMNNDLFVRFKEAAGTEATVVVNYFYARYGKTPCGTREGRVKQAANYAAAFVYDMNIRLGANIKYWEIGNECYGSWEHGFYIQDPSIPTMTGKEYGEDFRVFAEAMKAVDPAIKVGLVVKEEDWNAGALHEAQHHADFLVYHEYFTGHNTASYENVMNAVSLIDEIYERLHAETERYTDYDKGYFPIAMTEFNSRGPITCSMGNGLFINRILGELIQSGYGLSTLWVAEWRWNEADKASHGFLSRDDPEQADYTPRQAYLPYYYYPKMMGDKLLQVYGENSAVKAFASSFTSGEKGYVLMNISDKPQRVSLQLPEGTHKAYWYECYADHINTDLPGYKKFYVNGQTSITTGGGPVLDNVPAYTSNISSQSVFELRPHSFIYVTVKSDTSDISDISAPNTPSPSINTIVENSIDLNVFNDLISASVYNSTGQILVKSVDLKNKRINLQHIASGSYLLQIRTKNSTFAYKLIKI